MIAAVLLLGLFGRIMAFPMGHDEQGHVAAARLLFDEPLYRTLGYNHFPGLPLLLGIVYAVTGADRLLLTGRLLIFGCWVATAAVLWLIARSTGPRGGGHEPIAIFAILALAGSGFLDPAGMLVTNNFLPVPFALLGLYLFVAGMTRTRPSPWMIGGAGLAIATAVMMKVAFVFTIPCFVLAAMLIHSDTPPIVRARTVILPLATGGLLGGTPLLFYLVREPSSLLAHTIRYFTGPHLAYWRQAQEPKVMALQGKIVIAEHVWLAAACALAAFLAALFIIMAWTRRDGDRAGSPLWPVGLCAALAASGALLSFMPTPAFPQYYLPPVPFVVAAVIYSHGVLDARVSVPATPMLWIASTICLAAVAPRLIEGLPEVVRPTHWTGARVHADGERLRTLVGQSDRPVATLSPILPLEGGLRIYPEFANGPFVYRLAPFISARDRRWFVTTSPATLDRFLDDDHPSAIVTGWEDGLDPAFDHYAIAHPYRAVALSTTGAHAFVAAAPTQGAR